jgi:hypothetical protein
MTLTLHLGVAEISYVAAPNPGQKKATASTVTTADVAQFLEEKYHPMETFANVHGQEMADALAQSMVGALENLELGAPLSQNVFGEAESKIEHMFKKFITMGEMDSLGIPGVPTQAAKDRASGKKRSSRMKNKRRGGNAKPISFYDTGLYESSMKAWIE